MPGEVVHYCDRCRIQGRWPAGVTRNVVGQCDVCEAREQLWEMGRDKLIEAYAEDQRSWSVTLAGTSVTLSAENYALAVLYKERGRLIELPFRMALWLRGYAIRESTLHAGAAGIPIVRWRLSTKGFRTLCERVPEFFKEVTASVSGPVRPSPTVWERLLAYD